MLKKNKLLSLVTILLVVVYGVGMYFSFGNARAESWDAMNEFESNVIGRLSEYSDMTYEDGKVNLTLDEAIVELMRNYCDVPYSVCFFDEKGKLAGSTQDYIYFWDEKADCHYCFLDDYMNEDIAKKIKDSYQSGALLGECWFYYFEDENGKITPVTFVFKNPQNNNIIEEIAFCEYDQYGDKDKQFGTYLSVNKEVTKKIQSPIHTVEFEIPHLLSKPYVAKGCKDAKNKIVNDVKHAYNESEQSQYELLLALDPDGVGMPVAFKDGTYNAYVVANNNPNLYALNNHDFKSQAIIMTAVFVGAYVVAFAFIQYYYKKQMLSRAQYDFTNAAAHELKTPLAVIQNQCECIMENVNSENNEGYVQSIYEEALRMNKLVKNLLEYNLLSSQQKLKQSSVNLSVTVNSEVQKYKSLLSIKDLSIIKDVEPDCYVNCNDELIALVIDNFLSNAVKFAEHGSDIRVSLTKKDNKFVFSVFDKGSQISRKNDKALWTLLYKEDESRNDSSSSGIGLAVSARILDMHKFKYGYVNRDGGVEFYFVAK